MALVDGHSALLCGVRRGAINDRITIASLSAQTASAKWILWHSMEASGVESTMALMAKVERLERKNAELEKRVEELNLACSDLQNICAANGLNYEEALSTRRHRRC